MREVRQFATAGEVAKAAAVIFVRIGRRAIEERGKFFAALAGGSTPLATYRVIAASRSFLEGEWERTHIFFGDERCVPDGSPDRNDRAARSALLDHVPIPGANVHTVDAMAWDAAERYEAEIRHAFGNQPGEIPSFDLIFLGMGPDGHTASLFPGHPALEERERLVVRIEGAPKPPPERVTFTLPLINAARHVLFLVTGRDKAAALARVFRGDRTLPASRVSRREEPAFLVDDEAFPSSKNAPPSAALGPSS